MIDLYLPLVLGLMLGITPPGLQTAPLDGAHPVPPALADMPMLAPLPEGSGDDLDATRPPEPQTPSGKFTTATEVRPILGATKTNWVAVREFEGQDLVYFTHLLAWRCGLWDIRYGINGAPADRVLAMEPCDDTLAQPNAMHDVDNFSPYVVYPLGTVESVSVEIVYDDGTTDFTKVSRSAVQIP